jgi:hypothetical protein
MKFETTLDCGAIDQLDVTVDCDFEKGQKLIINPIEEAQEGIPDYFIINSVTAVIDSETVELLPLITEYDINQLEIEAGEQ